MSETNKKSPRYLLFVWGVGEIIIALSLLFVWQVETGILYWIKDLLFCAFLITGLLSLKDGIFASDADILKKMEGGGRDKFESTPQTYSFIKILKKIQDMFPGGFAVVTILFFVFYFGSFYMPGKNIIEGILITLMIILGLPVLIFW